MIYSVVSLQHRHFPTNNHNRQWRSIRCLLEVHTLGLYSLSGKTSYCKISWSLEAARFGFKLFQSLWNLAGTSAALLPRCLSNFRAIRPLQHPISRLRDFTRFGGKTSYRLVNRGPDIYVCFWHCSAASISCYTKPRYTTWQHLTVLGVCVAFQKMKVCIP